MSYELLSTPLHGIYIPSAMIVFGTLIVKPSYVVYAIALAVVLVAFKIWRGRTVRVLQPAKYQSLPLGDKIIISHNVAIYRFTLPSANCVLGLPIGQHVTVAAEIDGKEVTRSYTPISSDDDKGHFDLLIKTYPTGNISRVFGTLKIGDTIRVKGPKGQMIYAPGIVKQFGMIAGGTGITPMLQIIRAILKNPKDTTDVTLIFANVNEEDILLRDDLDQLAKEHSNFRVRYVLNNPPEGWTGGTGFVTAEMIMEHCPPPSNDMKLLLCGPPPMIGAMKKVTEGMGYDRAKPVSYETLPRKANSIGKSTIWFSAFE